MSSCEDKGPKFKVGRAEDRHDFEASVQFRAGRRRATVKVKDLSTRGARISAIHLLREGEHFSLELPTLEALEARVVWANEFELGCEFVKPLYPSVLDLLLTRLKRE